jgi:hypothetical protein
VVLDPGSMAAMLAAIDWSSVVVLVAYLTSAATLINTGVRVTHSSSYWNAFALLLL